MRCLRSTYAMASGGRVGGTEGPAIRMRDTRHRDQAATTVPAAERPAFDGRVDEL
ncbi:hypothetical protein ACFO4E_06420 [Nocardiopsis mangrovi]|uniref:Uncharacterized protein n=1 Tax=Nocardiopsis mangrovi TaxID=1179818 RepID=A0ABV9DSW5_9ACTN